MIEITLPWPPSVNTYWRHPSKGPLAGRHLISEQGRRYRTEVLACVLTGRQDKRLSGSLAVSIFCHPPDRRQRDLDNLLKSLLDALTHSQVIVDDSCIDSLTIRRGHVSPPGCVIVSISHNNTEDIPWPQEKPTSSRSKSASTSTKMGKRKATGSPSGA